MKMGPVETVFIVTFGITLVLPSNQNTAEDITSNIIDRSNIRENFGNLLNSITNNDVKDADSYRSILEQEAVRERETFDAIKERSRFTGRTSLSQNVNADGRAAVFKRDAYETGPRVGFGATVIPGMEKPQKDEEKKGGRKKLEKCDPAAEAAARIYETACYAAEEVYDLAEIGVEVARQVSRAAVAATREIGRSRPPGNHSVDESVLQKTKTLHDKMEEALKAAREGAEKTRETARQAPGRTTISPNTSANATESVNKLTTAAAALRVAEAARQTAQEGLRAAEAILAAAESAVTAVQLAFADGNDTLTWKEWTDTTPSSSSTTKKGDKKKTSKKKKQEKEDDMSYELRYGSDKGGIHF